MISATLINKCAHLNSNQIETLLRKNKFILNSEFLGINNNNEFCYRISTVDVDNEIKFTKVFIRENMIGELVIDY